MDHPNPGQASAVEPGGSEEGTGGKRVGFAASVTEPRFEQAGAEACYSVMSAKV